MDFLLEHDFASLPSETRRLIKEQGRQTPKLSISNNVKSGTGKRSFVKHFHCSSYERIPWLTGCPKRNKLYCFPCLLFANKRSSVWISSGFCSLGNLSKSARLHCSSKNHKFSEISLERLGETRPVGEALSQAFQESIRVHNRKVDHNISTLSRLVDCVRFLGTHELAFRGDNEESTSDNRGNYKDLVGLLAKYDSVMREHLQSATVFRGDSSKIQNDLIEALAACITRRIQQEISDATFVSILADEATDLSVSSQFSLSVRYVKDWYVCERFIGFFNVSGNVNADSLSALLVEKVRTMNMSEKLVAQSYDGASTMSGAHRGVQTQITSLIPTATYIHCYEHRLNLVLQKAIGNLSPAKIFFTTLSGLHAFFSRSPKRRSILNYLDSSLHVTAPSQTRWSFKGRAIENLLKNFGTYVNFFQNGADGKLGFSDLPPVECAGFLSTITSRNFRFLLCLFSKIFKPAMLLFEQIQRIESCLPQVTERIEFLCQSIKELWYR